MNDYNSSDDESTTILTQDMLGDSFGDNTDKLTSDMKEEFQNAKRNAMAQNNMASMNQGQRPMQQPPMGQGQRPMQQPPMGQGQRPMQQPPMGQGQRPMQQPPMGQGQRPMQQPPMGQGQRPMQQPPMGQGQRPMQQPPMGQGQKPVQQAPNNQKKDSNGRKNEKSGKKTSGGTIAYTIISLVLICGLAGLCVWGYLHYDKKVKNLNEEKANLATELDASKSEKEAYEAEIDEKDMTINELNTQISDAQSVSGKYETIINYLNSYGISGGYLDYFISAKDITLKSGEEATFTIFVENPDNGIYYEQTSSDIAWIETTSDAYDGNPNIKGFTVHGFQPGTVNVSLIATDTNEIINLTIHVLD